MEIKIEGDPGTGNTFMEINIQHVEHFTPYAPLNNNSMRASRQSVELQVMDVELIRTNILDYINRLRNCLADEWKSTYKQMWKDILDMEVVSASVYSPGKQQGTNFNRSLVANIIYYLSGKGVYCGKYNAASMAEYLEGNKEHSVRSALGKNPSEAIISRLNRYFER